jgi:hypothetical protein
VGVVLVAPVAQLAWAARIPAVLIHGERVHVARAHVVLTPAERSHVAPAHVVLTHVKPSHAAQVSVGPTFAGFPAALHRVALVLVVAGQALLVSAPPVSHASVFVACSACGDHPLNDVGGYGGAIAPCLQQCGEAVENGLRAGLVQCFDVEL